MSKNEAFLRAILDDPEDDAVRLVYADWLEDHGQAERAELIRVQVELANLPPGHPRGEDLTDRAWALLRQHRERWEAELPDLRGLGRWHRGFIDEMILEGGAVSAERAEAILAAVPLRRLRLIDWCAYGSLAGSPLLVRTRELEIRVQDHSEMYGGEFEDADLEEVLGWPAAERLTHLGLEGHRLTDRGVRMLTEARLPHLRSLALRHPWGMRDTDLWGPLLRAGWLAQLEALTVEKHPLPRGLVGPFCERLRLGRVRSLALTAVSIGDGGAADLVRTGLPGSLTDLRLADNRIGPAGARLLGEALPAGVQLTLDGNPLVGEGGLRALAGSPLLAYLTHLSLTGPGADEEGALSLAESPHAHRLRAVILRGGSVGSAGARALLTSASLAGLGFVDLGKDLVAALPAFHHPGLKILALDENRLGDEGVAGFCAGSRLPALRYLSVKRNRLGPETAAALATGPGWGALENLHLDGNPLGDAGARALAVARGLPRLTTLALTGCGIGDEGLAAWMDSPLLARLKRLRLKGQGNPIREEVYEAFRQRAAEIGCEVS